MAKKKGFDLKGIQKNALGAIGEVVITASSMVASKKFLNFNTLMKNADPDSFIIKNQGWIKLLLGGVIVAGSSGMKTEKMGGLNIIKALGTGIALEGGVSAIRQITSKTAEDGTIEYLFEPIGNVQTLKRTSAVGQPQTPAITTAVGGVGGMGVIDAEEIDVLDEEELNDDL